ncbi:ABC-2 type transport system permease protein [Kribbella antiqua]|uniref:ABC-2 type transport system permease protein n=1 Tax=Kribbella antiqua TaxID=2512217 RepID=A0A4R2J8H4_9ACTN|nr:ABC-2 family transporter protein [Kribbella antiqua]TCO51325.1 ABC-2 type transport system permease protein [Kribbella antiqua]
MPVDTLSTRLTGLRGLYRAGYRSVLVYRADLLFGIAGLVIQATLTVVVWRVLYDGHDEVAGVGASTAVAYAVLAACIQSILMPWQFSSLPLRVLRGQIGVDMMRPRSLISQNLAQAAGTMVGRLPVGAAGLLTGLALGGVKAPHTLPDLLAWVVSMVLGIANVMIINLLVSMIAFWTVEIGGIMILYRFGSAFLSGALIPLWFMPGWLQPIISWLPFQAQIYAPLSIWFGTRHGVDLLGTLALQLGWVLVLFVLLQLVWRRAVHKVVVFGG